MKKTTKNDNILMVICATFIVLKVFGVLRWGWIWIFSPLWIPILLLGIIIALPFCLAVIINLLKKIK